jgi:hypothetical protein
MPAQDQGYRQPPPQDPYRQPQDPYRQPQDPYRQPPADPGYRQPQEPPRPQPSGPMQPDDDWGDMGGGSKLVDFIRRG